MARKMKNTNERMEMRKMRIGNGYAGGWEWKYGVASQVVRVRARGQGLMGGCLNGASAVRAVVVVYI